MNIIRIDPFFPFFFGLKAIFFPEILVVFLNLQLKKIQSIDLTVQKLQKAKGR